MLQFSPQNFKWNCLLEQKDCSSHTSLKKNQTEQRLGTLLRLFFQMKIAKKERVQSPCQFSSKQVFQHFLKRWGAGIWHLVGTNWTYSSEKQVFVWDPTFCLRPMRSHISSYICKAISHWLWPRLGSYPWQSLQSSSENIISVVLHSHTSTWTSLGFSLGTKIIYLLSADQ